MEKLKLVLVYRFWILCTVSLLLPPIGWWMASGALVAEIEDRSNSLESTFKSIPPGSGAPNQHWIDEVARRNQLRVASNAESASRLWQMQQALMVWPADIKDVMARCPYREKIADFGAAQDVPDLYIHDYPNEIRKLWLTVDPLDDEAGNLADANSKRKVKFELSDIPRVPATKWQNLPPSWTEMWDVQEDIWLMKELLAAIARVNAGDFNITDSYIKQIEQIRLFGGDRIVVQPAASGTAEGGGADAVAGGGGVQGPYGGGGLGKGRGSMGDGRLSGQQGQSKGVSADFSLSEDFTNVVYAGGGKSDKKSSRNGSVFGAKGPVAGMDANSADSKAGGDPNTPKKQERYVDELGVPYRTRGFYLKVVIDHRRVPDLLVELANAKWPVEFVRVQQTSQNDQGSGGDLMGSGNENAFAQRDPSGGGLQGKRPMGSAKKKDDKQTESERMQSLAKAALADPNLATVVVAGLMTIYDPPKVDEQTLAGASPAGGVGGAALGSATQSLPTRGATPPAAGTATGQPATTQPAPAATNTDPTNGGGT